MGLDGGSALSFSRQMSAKGLICRIDPSSRLFSVLQANDKKKKKTSFSVENIDPGAETFILLTARSDEGAETQCQKIWLSSFLGTLLHHLHPNLIFTLCRAVQQLYDEKNFRQVKL